MCCRAGCVSSGSAGGGTRLVMVTSLTHRGGRLDFDVLHVIFWACGSRKGASLHVPSICIWTDSSDCICSLTDTRPRFYAVWPAARLHRPSATAIRFTESEDQIAFAGAAAIHSVETVRRQQAGGRHGCPQLPAPL